MNNIASREFVWTKRTDVAKRFRDMGWEPPERNAEETDKRDKADGALRAMKKLQAEGRLALVKRKRA